MKSLSAEELIGLVSKFTSSKEVLHFYSVVADAADVLVKAAVAEERERCAKIAKDYARNGAYFLGDTSEQSLVSTSTAIAAAIRESKDRGGDPPQAETK